MLAINARRDAALAVAHGWPGWPGKCYAELMEDAVSISEAKTQLSKLIARAERGEEVTIRRGRKAVAKIVPLEPPEVSSRRVIGALRGEIWIADDFDELGPEWAEYM